MAASLSMATCAILSRAPSPSVTITGLVTKSTKGARDWLATFRSDALLLSSSTTVVCATTGRSSRPAISCSMKTSIIPFMIQRNAFVNGAKVIHFCEIDIIFFLFSCIISEKCLTLHAEKLKYKQHKTTVK